MNGDNDMITRVQRNRAIAERIYQAFLKEVDALPEEEWRTVNLTCINRLMDGLNSSLSMDVSRRELTISNGCRLTPDAFGHWILRNADRPLLAWAGSGWAPVHDNGLPAGNFQICNFGEREDADAYAREFGLIVVADC